VDDDDAEDVRPLSPTQLAAFLNVVHPRHRLMFRFLASTGLRVSELIALQWRHLSLDGSNPHVRVRRAIVRGRVQPPKTRHGRRSVPLDRELVAELRSWQRQTEWPGPDDLVFPSMVGKPIHVENLRRRHLRPAAEEAGAPWCGFHTFRHTCATLLFDAGRNAKQVQKWLGHHSAAFTLDTYIHLMPDDPGDPLDLSAVLRTADRAAPRGGGRVTSNNPQEESSRTSLTPSVRWQQGGNGTHGNHG
jgi:integrase